MAAAIFTHIDVRLRRSQHADTGSESLLAVAAVACVTEECSNDRVRIERKSDSQINKRERKCCSWWGETIS